MQNNDVTLPKTNTGIPRADFKERVGGLEVQWVGRLGAMGAMVYSKFLKIYTLPKTNSKRPLKIGLNAPEGSDPLPKKTHFHGPTCC